MYPIDQAFIDALYSSAMEVVVRATTLSGVELTIEDGSVTMDSRREIQRDCDLQIVPTELSSKDIYRLLMLPQTEVKIERGLRIGGVEIYIPLGVFSTDNCEISRSKGGLVKFAGSDRAKKISRARFIDPFVVTRGTTIASAGAALISDRLPSAEHDFTAVTEATDAQLVFEAGADSDPWKSARDMFAGFGYDLHFDGNGVCRATPIPDPATSRVAFSFGSGEANMLLDATTTGSLEKTYNGVVACGEGSDVVAAVRATAWDEDVQSPTYVGYGKVPYFYFSPLLTTLGMCEQAARTMLAKVKGSTEQITWPAIVNPALEPLDVVTINVDGAESTCVIDSLTIPLKASASMSAIARETRRL